MINPEDIKLRVIDDFTGHKIGVKLDKVGIQAIY